MLFVLVAVVQWSTNLFERYPPGHLPLRCQIDEARAVKFCANCVATTCAGQRKSLAGGRHLF